MLSRGSLPQIPKNKIPLTNYKTKSVLYISVLEITGNN